MKMRSFALPSVQSPLFGVYLGLAGLLALIAAPLSARADIYTWNPATGGNSGSFDAKFWNDLSGPPGPNDTAIIPGGVVLTSTGDSVNTLDVNSSLGASLTLSGAFFVQNLGSLGLTGGGTLTADVIGGPTVVSMTGDSADEIMVSGASLVANSVIHAEFSISGGGSAVVAGAISGDSGGFASGAMSFLQINGSVTNGSVGSYSGGTFMAQSLHNDGSIDVPACACDGAGSLFAISGDAEFDGRLFQVTNGGQATIGGDLKFYFSQLSLAGGAGSGGFDGAGTKVTVTGDVVAGPGPGASASAQVGGFTISNGALLHASSVFLDGNATNTGGAMMTNGAMMQVDSGLGIGNASMSQATLSISSGSGVTVSSPAGAGLAVGFIAGGAGSVTISGSGSFVNATNVGIGVSTGSMGDVELDTSAVMQVSSGGFLDVGESGTGTMEIRSGASVQVAGSSTTFDVGRMAGSSGTVTVNSPNGLTLAGSAVVGDQGMGEMDIYGTGNSGSASGNLTIGKSNMGNGLVTVSGGAQFAVSGGAKTLLAQVGGSSRSKGEIWALGTGTTLTLTGLTTVGLDGIGEAAATGGATVQSTGMRLAASTGSYGTLLVYDPGTVWTETEFLYVGSGVLGNGGGMGLASVNNGGLLRIYKKLYIPSSGIVAVTALPTNDSVFPKPPPPVTSSPNGRIFVGADNFGPDGAIRVGNGGLLTGKGYQVGTTVKQVNVLGNVVIGLGGRFQPGGDPDFFTITGDCDLSDGGAGGGETDFEIAGAGTPGVDYDQLNVSGAVTLGGTLKLYMINGYTPNVGDSLAVIAAGSQSGSFASVVSPGVSVSPVSGVSGTMLMVTAVTPGFPYQTSATIASGQPGQAFNYQIAASNSPTSFTATGLPAGLTVDPGSGIISGTPTATGDFSVDLTFTNAAGTGEGLLDLSIGVPSVHPAFFNGEAPLSNGVYYLAFPNGNFFGYYTYEFFPFLYHFDLGFEYFIDAQNSLGGCYLYDFASNTFWYTDPTLFPYLYDFSLNAFIYYYPDTKNAGRYTSNPRYFFNFGTGQIITK